MKSLNFVVLLFLIFQLSHSQAKKIFSGRVLYQSEPIKGVEVINATNSKIVITDGEGRFAIEAKAKDVLVFVAKNYEEKKVSLFDADLNNDNFSIVLVLQSIALDDVVVNQKYLDKIAYDSRLTDQFKFEMEQARLKNPFIYDGRTTNGVDFIRLGKDATRLFKKIFNIQKKVPAYKINPMAFKEYLAAHFDQDFFTKKLNLLPEEITLFIEFCNSDTKSIGIVENDTTFLVMDFLITKSSAFKKLPKTKR